MEGATAQPHHRHHHCDDREHRRHGDRCFLTRAGPYPVLARRSGPRISIGFVESFEALWVCDEARRHPGKPQGWVETHIPASDVTRLCHPDTLPSATATCATADSSRFACSTPSARSGRSTGPTVATGCYNHRSSAASRAAAAGDFYGDDTDDGRPIRVLLWSEIRAESGRWHQAFSLDGEIWEANWIMELTRAGVIVDHESLDQRRARDRDRGRLRDGCC